MKFAEHLGSQVTPEWRKQYIQYDLMKKMLHQAMEEAPSTDGVEEEELQRHFAKFDEKFFTFCDKELIKINTFFSEKLAEATRKLSALQTELSVAIERQTSEKGTLARLGRNKAADDELYSARVRNLPDLKLIYSEYYLSLILLQKYQDLNHTGFRKIMKKHDKNLKTDAGTKWVEEQVDVANFCINKDINKLLRATESTFINDLEGGDRQRAMKRLRVPPLGGTSHSPWITYKVGLFSGAFVVLGVNVVLASLFHDFGGKERDDWRIVFRLYRGPFLVILFMFLLGLNVYGWRSSGVNHVLIFELDPRNHLAAQHLMEVASILGVIWTLSVLGFVYSDVLRIPAFVHPLMLTVVMILFLLNPTKTLRHEARFWTLRKMGRIFGAPFFAVAFADFWLADQMNSLAPAFADFHYLVCFYSSSNATVNDEWMVAVDSSRCVNSSNWMRPVLMALPAWFRFAQCLRRYRDSREAFPHLVNALKYSTTFLVVIFSFLHTNNDDTVTDPFFYLWICSSVVSSMFAYIWDIKMDWGLFHKNAGENTFLREEIVYSKKRYYYFAMLEDFVLRFGWTISLSLNETVRIPGDLLTSIFSPLEVFRRFVWNFFRLENEHLNNCGKFRAVRDISVAPIDTSDQALIIKLMDNEDGVLMVRRRMPARHQKKSDTTSPKTKLQKVNSWGSQKS